MFTIVDCNTQLEKMLKSKIIIIIVIINNQDKINQTRTQIYNMKTKKRKKNLEIINSNNKKPLKKTNVTMIQKTCNTRVTLLRPENKLKPNSRTNKSNCALNRVPRYGCQQECWEPHQKTQLSTAIKPHRLHPQTYFPPN